MPRISPSCLSGSCRVLLNVARSCCEAAGRFGCASSSVACLLNEAFGTIAREAHRGDWRRIVRFQDATNSVDDAAAAILAVDRADLPCMRMLLFGGPASAEQLAALPA